MAAAKNKPVYNRQDIYCLVLSVLQGEVATYGQIALKAGNPKWAQAVGNDMNKARLEEAEVKGEKVRWWRIVKKDGRISDRAPKQQRKLLVNDGVRFISGRVEEGFFKWGKPKCTTAAKTKLIHSAIPDVQGRADHRDIALDWAGVKGLRRPVRFVDGDGEVCSTVAELSLFVNLEAERKATHMSRFVELLEEHDGAFSLAGFGELLARMTARLDAGRGRVELQFPLFLAKRAPVSGIAGLMDYRVALSGEIRGGECRVQVTVVVPVTSLCPCSREVSKYGAHNQRTHITMRITPAFGATLTLAELIRSAEQQASCELFSVLKRTDEKFVTERAYENPKFVEDIARDVALALDQNPAVAGYCVEAENFESIHNHSAYAKIERDAQAKEQPVRR